MAFPITKTTKHHINEAIQFTKRTGIYFAFGRTTAWEDENIPPTPTVDTDIEEVIGYKKAEIPLLVVQDNENGTIVYPDGSKWRVVPENQAFIDLPVHVYLKCVLDFGELNNTSHRQVAVFTGLTKAQGVDENLLLLTPAQVANAGVQEIITNKKVYPRYENIQEEFSMIIRL